MADEPTTGMSTSNEGSPAQRSSQSSQQTDYQPNWVRADKQEAVSQQDSSVATVFSDVPVDSRTQVEQAASASQSQSDIVSQAPVSYGHTSTGSTQMQGAYSYTQASDAQTQQSYEFGSQQASAGQQQASFVQQQTTQPMPQMGMHAASSMGAAYTAGQGSAGASGSSGVGGASSFVAPTPDPRHSSGGNKGVKTFALAFAGAALACIVIIAIAVGTGVFSTTVTLGATTSTQITASDEDASLAEQVAAKALPSVAAITVYAEQSTSSSMYYDLFSYGYGYNYGYDDSSDSTELVEYSQGSGVVLTSDGYIITNYHVIEGGSAFEVTVDGQTYEAELVGYDSSGDIAVLKCVNASDLTPIEIADSDEITVGEWVMTIGSPFGLEQSVATGIVSATSRSQVLSSSTDGSTTVYTNLVQTDAAINPGNSGGALVNSDGQLIGINTLIISSSESYSGVGFAIPSNYAISVAEQLINGETPTHASLGVTMTTIDTQSAQRYGFSASEGAYVTAVASGSGAEAAGIEVGDIITAVDGEAITGASDLQLAIRSHDPGDVVTVTVNRNGTVLDFEVTLGEDDDETYTTQ